MAPNRQHKKQQSRPSNGPSPGQADNLREKRERFEEAGRFPVRKMVLAVSVILVVALVGMAAWSKLQESKQASSGIAVATQTTGSSSAPGAASGGTIAMTPIALTVAGESASFGLADVQKNTLVSMKYKRLTPMAGEWQQITGGELPLISYVAPSGNLVVATSFCEPCRSTSFHIEGNAIVCDTCFTKWDLNTLEGISGGCTAYPPQPLTVQNQNGKITVLTADLEKWAPRA